MVSTTEEMQLSYLDKHMWHEHYGHTAKMAMITATSLKDSREIMPPYTQTMHI